jgi:AcrR family transcriptional regulator
VPRGRERTFDTDVALERAVELFSRQGYEGTSIAELTKAMEISPPSLYAAFGNKRKLFDLVVQRYREQRSPYMEDALGQPTAQLVAEAFLVGAAEHDARPGKPPGCLTVRGCLASGDEDTGVVELLSDQRRANQEALQRRLEQGVLDGDLPAGTNCAAVARYLATVAQGIAVQASGGATQAQLLEVAAVALTAVPVPPRHDRLGAA